MHLHIANLWNGDAGEMSRLYEVNIVLIQNNEPCLKISINAPFIGNDMIPPTNNHRSHTQQLWEYEVVEIFISSHILNNDVSTTPYTEIILNPYGHWLIIKHTGQDNWSSCDDTIVLDPSFLPDFQIDHDKQIWYGDVIIPLHLLPPPHTPADAVDRKPQMNQVSWLFNAYAIHNKTPCYHHISQADSRDDSSTSQTCTSINNHTDNNNDTTTTTTTTTSINTTSIERKYLAYNPVPGDYPRFHQLHAFSSLQLLY
jgi:hypothetical protein